MDYADTKISSGTTELTSQGSKVLELNIICKTIGGNSYGEVYYKTSLTYTYAGSSLIGLNTYATLQSILNSLGGGSKDNKVVPDHISILNTAKEIVKLYASSIQSPVELAISGFCPKSCQPFIGTVRMVLEDGLAQYKVTFDYALQLQMSCVLLGDHKATFQELLDQKLALIKDFADYHYWRTPISALNDFINDTN